MDSTSPSLCQNKKKKKLLDGKRLLVAVVDPEEEGKSDGNAQHTTGARITAQWQGKEIAEVGKTSGEPAKEQPAEL
jgi:hypothetical protein